jgi:diacylglycerol kinase family enzyme
MPTSAEVAAGPSRLASSPPRLSALPPRRAALIYNPASGRRRHERLLGGVRAALAAAGWTAEPIPTPGPGGATALARQLAAAGDVAAVLAYGGDGTVREVAAGLIGTGVALGILPGGTVNLLARAVGLPASPLAAASLLAGLTPRPLDVGLAGETPFLMMVSAGVDGAALAALDSRLKGRFGRSAVVAQALREWWRYPYPELAVEADGRATTATFAVVANIPLYAGPFRLVPQARPDDGRLDLLVFRGGRAATARFAWDLLRAAHVRRRDVEVFPVTEVRLAGPPGARAQVDGDPCPEPLPLRIRLAPEKLLVLAP